MQYFNKCFRSLRYGIIAVCGFMLSVGNLQAQTTLTWERLYGGALEEEGLSVCTTANGDAVVVGYTYSYNTTATLNANVFVKRVDGAGAIVWQQIFDVNTSRDWADVMVTSDDHVVFCTNIYDSSGLNSWDPYVVKLRAADGVIQWQHQMKTPSIGEWATSIIETSDGNYVIAGYASPAINPNSRYDILLFKLDYHQGWKIWSNVYGQAFGSADEVALCVRQAEPFGPLYVCGASTNALGFMYDAMLMITNRSGQWVWNRRYDFSQFGDIFARMVFGPNDKLYPCGFVEGRENSVGLRPLVAKFDYTTTNATLHAHTNYYDIRVNPLVQGFGEAVDIRVSPRVTNALVVAGSFKESTSVMHDFFAMELGLNLGAPNWITSFGTQNNDQARGLMPFKIRLLPPYQPGTFDMGYWITGSYDNTGMGMRDIALIRSDRTGRTQCNAEPLISDLPIYNVSTNAFVTVQHGSTEPVTYATTTGIEMIVHCPDKPLLPASKSGVGYRTILDKLQGEARTYPNPIDRGNELVLEFQSSNSGPAVILTVDNHGRQIKSEKVILSKGANAIPISTAGLSAGVYIISIETDSDRLKQRIIVR